MRVVLTSNELGNQARTNSTVLDAVKEVTAESGLLVSSRESARVHIVEQTSEAYPAKFWEMLQPVAGEGLYYRNDDRGEFLPPESILTLNEGTPVFAARLSEALTLQRMESERGNFQFAVLWNDLPFGIIQCALEIEALSLSKKLQLPVIWISTRWENRSAHELYRRGYWVSNANGEIVRGEYQTDYANSSFLLPSLQDLSLTRTGPREMREGEIQQRSLRS